MQLTLARSGGVQNEEQFMKLREQVIENMIDEKLKLITAKVEFDFRPPTKPSKAMQQLRVQKQRAHVDIRREKPGWLRDLETYPEEWSGPKLVDDEAPRRTFLQTEESEA